MTVKAKLHIIVPGLCGPLAATDVLEKSVACNAWLKRLSQAKNFNSATNLHDVLASIFHLKFNNDFPATALTLLAKNLYHENKHYMFADPVHLQADMNQAVLTSAEDLTINEEESSQLLQALNSHFKQDDLEYFAIDNKQWIVASNNAIDIKTTALVDAVSRNINFILPEGNDATRWRQLLTEAQMLLHAHEVNSHREDSAQDIINSLWFHGCGGLPDIDELAFNNNKITSVCSDHSLLKGIADLVGSDYMPLPVNTSDYIQQLLVYKALAGNNNSLNVLHLSAMEHLVNYTDVSLWLDKLIMLLEQWLYPLITMANKNDIQIILYPCAGKKYYFSKYDFLKIWQQAKLEQHVRCY
ncbi:MAG: hypothetical protein JKX75_08325 [Gammaproteobacteria bacterium]|nr:hypothetical protein [Gammaproteobacteria bacterium]